MPRHAFGPRFCPCPGPDAEEALPAQEALVPEGAASRMGPNAPVEAGQDTNIVPCVAKDSLRSGRRPCRNAQARGVEG